MIIEELRLDWCDEFGKEQAIEAFEARDGCAFADSAYSTSAGLLLVSDNRHVLKARGMYEAALVTALTGCKHNHSGWDTTGILDMFRFGDPKGIRDAGSPLPERDRFTLYRGVAGTGKRRRIGGLSWTDSLNLACWFAMRLGLPNPAVYSATVRADQILCYYTERDESEFVCQPRSRRLVNLLDSEIRSLASQEQARKKAAEKREMEQWLAHDRATSPHDAIAGP